MHFTLICIIISIIGVDAHTGRQTESSERGETRLFGHRAKQITKGQVRGERSCVECGKVTRIPVLTRPHPSAAQKRRWACCESCCCRDVGTTMNHCRPCASLRLHPTCFSVFRSFQSAAHSVHSTEEDSRAELSDILWGSVNVDGGGGGA